LLMLSCCQMVRNYRKPLIVVGPKVLLRHPSAVSTISDMLPGTVFQTVLPDHAVKDPQTVTRVVFMTGKHFYAVDKERQTRAINNMAIIRLEVRFLVRLYSAILQYNFDGNSALEIFWSNVGIVPGL